MDFRVGDVVGYICDGPKYVPGRIHGLRDEFFAVNWIDGKGNGFYYAYDELCLIALTFAGARSCFNICGVGDGCSL